LPCQLGVLWQIFDYAMPIDKLVYAREARIRAQLRTTFVFRH